MSLAKYTPEETAAKREFLLKQFIEPQVLRLFRKFVYLRSAVLMVGQYFDDEAYDAVHGTLIVSELETPDLKAFEAAEFSDPVNLPHIPENSQDWWDLVTLFTDGWDDNRDAISLFAAFTREANKDDDRFTDALSVYAHFRRAEEGIETQVVGVMHRPWLDGVRPSYDGDDY